MKRENDAHLRHSDQDSRFVKCRRKVHRRSTSFSLHQLVAIVQLSVLFRTIDFRQWSPIVSTAFQNPGTNLKRQRCQFYHQTFRSTIQHQHHQKLYITMKRRHSTLQNQLGISLETVHSNSATQINFSSESKSSEFDEDVSKSTGTDIELPGTDIPMPTEAGGYSHTQASRAKISAANKGKTPWNKGKARSEEVKARIAEGVRRRNRERFLQKLEDMGLTEEEYEAKKKEERRQKDAERRDRKTEKGGYRLTDETKQKISRVLKEKHAKGEVKKREYKGPFRKGFSHSEETKEKIRESLKKKWAEVRIDNFF